MLDIFQDAVSVKTNANPLQAVTKEQDGTLTLTLEDGDRIGGFDQILLATGRKPMLDRLGLVDAGVKTENGYITVSRKVAEHTLLCI